MKPGDISVLLSAGNPWWQDAAGWPARDVQLRAAAASGLDYTPQVLTEVPRGGLVMLRGPRRVGKSVELKRHVQREIAAGTPPRSIIHAAVDGWKATDLRTLVDVGRRLAPAAAQHRLWLIDEVSSVMGWAPVVKWLRDNDPDFAGDTVILTGSSAADLTSATSSLAGRRGPVSRPDRTLLPMGFRSFAATMLTSRGLPVPDAPRLEPHELRSPSAAEAFDALSPWLGDLVGWWEVYLACGGFPQAVAAQLTGDDAAPIVQALFDVVRRDVFGAVSLTETQVIALLARLTENLTNPVNISTIARDIGVSADTLTRRLLDLDAAYLTWPCHQSDRLRPRLGSQSKRYFTDPLLARLAHLRHSAHRAPDLTQLTEQQLGMALTRRLEASAPGTYAGFDQLLYERTATRKEIDFVGAGLAPVAVEGKYTDGGGWAGEAATVNASRFSGLLATRTVLDTDAGSSGSWAIPASFLAYTLDS